MTARPRGPLRPDVATTLPAMSIWQRFRFSGEASIRSHPKSRRINFPNDALVTPRRQGQGFRRPGLWPFRLLGPSESDSTVRFDCRQDWGAILWVPLGILRHGRVDPAGFEPVPSRPAADGRRTGGLGRNGVGRGDGAICPWPGTGTCCRSRAATPCWPRSRLRWRSGPDSLAPGLDARSPSAGRQAGSFSF